MVRLVPDIVDADDGAAGLLIECRGWDESCLKVLSASVLLGYCRCCRSMGILGLLRHIPALVRV